jgi:hypothetical protein
VVIGSLGGKEAYRVLQALIFYKNVCVCGGRGEGMRENENTRRNWREVNKSFTEF